MKRQWPWLIVAALVAAVALAAWGGGKDNPERPGSAAVYAEIAAETDCARLQEMFTTAADNAERLQDADRFTDARVPMGYMDAADDRMRDVGCY